MIGGLIPIFITIYVIKMYSNYVKLLLKIANLINLNNKYVFESNIFTIAGKLNKKIIWQFGNFENNYLLSKATEFFYTYL